MKNKQSIILSTLIVMILSVGLVSCLDIRNYKDCDRFVIDSYEIMSGIDIPKQTNSKCHYDEKNHIRIGIYTIKQTHDFIEKYGLKELTADHDNLLWAQEFLVAQEAMVPVAANKLFKKQGDGEEYKWQCLLDRDSGKMWLEVQWEN